MFFLPPPLPSFLPKFISFSLSEAFVGAVATGAGIAFIGGATRTMSTCCSRESEGRPPRPEPSARRGGSLHIMRVTIASYRVGSGGEVLFEVQVRTPFLILGGCVGDRQAGR